jgi:lysophospholipase L1-like esterase
MPTQHPATHSPRLKNQVPPKVVALGDSLTYGYGDWEQGGWVDRSSQMSDSAIAERIGSAIYDSKIPPPRTTSPSYQTAA